jgi:hypothetical protein
VCATAAVSLVKVEAGQAQAGRQAPTTTTRSQRQAGTQAQPAAAPEY